MAIDSYHRLLVAGRRATVDLFRRRLRRVNRRTVAGVTWHERVPFSFVRLYELAPKAAQIEPYVPCEPYDISVWPIRPLPRGRAEIRYTLHTRNLELLPFVRTLSRAFSSLTFYLVTFCLDSDEIASYRICNGSVRTWILPEERKDAHWERARQKFGIAGDDLYEDDLARYFAEDGMLEEALDHWYQPEHGSAGLRRTPRNWLHSTVARDLRTEQEISLMELSELSSDEDVTDSGSAGARPKARRRSGAVRGPDRRRRA